MAQSNGWTLRRSPYVLYLPMNRNQYLRWLQCGDLRKESYDLKNWIVHENYPISKITEPEPDFHPFEGQGVECGYQPILFLSIYDAVCVTKISYGVSVSGCGCGCESDRSLCFPICTLILREDRNIIISVDSLFLSYPIPSIRLRVPHTHMNCVLSLL